MTVAPAPTGYGEYHLTDKGLDFKPVIIALTEWGDRWAAPEGPPIATSTTSAAVMSARCLICERCGSELRAADVLARPTDVMARALERRRGKAKRKSRK
jgi:hypothetical protein